MPSIRRPDWQSRLSALVAASLGRPFEWGQHDCALFAADAVLAMTGDDLAAEFRGRYKTARGAARRLAGRGFPSPAAAASVRFTEIAPALASDGDIAVFHGPEGQTLGILTGEMIAAPGPLGLGFVSRTEATRAFHVPFDGEDV